MKIICTQENLNQGLSIVSGISGKNPNLPILNNVLIKAEKGRIILSTTNLEIGINCIIRGKIENEGNFTVPARVFADYVNLLQKDNVSLELKDQEVELTTPNNKTRFKGSSPEEFPSIPKIKKEKVCSIGVSELRDGISSVLFAVANTSSRPEISGVVFDFNKDPKKLTIAATDSYRLAEKRIALKESEIENKKIIVPSKTLQEVIKILNLIKENKDTDTGGFVNIYLSPDNQILFTFPDTKIGTEDSIELVSRLVDGKYPEYKEIIPENHTTKITVNKKDLINIIKTSSLFAKSGANSIKLEFLNSNEVSVFSANSETGENLSKLSAKVDGNNNEITINYRYLLDGLSHINTDDVIINIISKDVPCLIKPINKEDYLYIVMPIRS